MRALGTYSPFVSLLSDHLLEHGWQFLPIEIAWTHDGSGLTARYLSGKGVRVEGAGIVSSSKGVVGAAAEVATKLIEMARQSTT